MPKNKKINNMRNIILCMFCIIILIIIIFFLIQFNKTKGTVLIDNIGNINLNSGTEKRIENAIDILEKGRQEAQLITKSNIINKKVELIFEGLLDMETTNEILFLLKKHNTITTFFITGIQAAEDTENVKTILEAGHTIGNYTLNGTKNMQSLSEGILIQDFARASNIIYNIIGTEPKVLKCNVTEYTKNILEVAKAVGIDRVVNTDYVVDINSFNSLDAAQGYINKLNKGSIVSIKINELIDEKEYINIKTDEKPAEDKKPQDNSEKDEKKEFKSIINTIKWILTAIDNTNYMELYEEIRVANNGEKAQPINEIRTTQRAVSFMFYDISNKKDNVELDSLLERLDKLNARATFLLQLMKLKTVQKKLKSF